LELDLLVEEHLDVSNALPDAARIAQVLDALTPKPHGVLALVLHDDLLEDAPVIVLATADNPRELQHLALAALDIDNRDVNSFSAALPVRAQLERLGALCGFRVEVKSVSIRGSQSCLQYWVKVSMLKSNGMASFSGIPYRFFAAKAGRPSTNK